MSKFLKYRDHKLREKSNEERLRIMEKPCSNPVDKPMSASETFLLLEQIERQRVMFAKPDLLIEYTNIAIIFGYITMFSSILPFIPAVALVGFFFKLWNDLQCMTTVF
jgi:hypothetical protein